ncbi:hypothetical protein BaRGS_00024399 [Batillaria attramentaria]|uniref:Uncharacterized protein n=1 Tax=Batillaria attramentaria TaxID=370345 RepID=A0ABD0KBD8_9CAEN
MQTATLTSMPKSVRKRVLFCGTHKHVRKRSQVYRKLQNRVQKTLFNHASVGASQSVSQAHTGVSSNCVKNAPRVAERTSSRAKMTQVCRKPVSLIPPRRRVDMYTRLLPYSAQGRGTRRHRTCLTDSKHGCEDVLLGLACSTCQVAKHNTRRRDLQCSSVGTYTTQTRYTLTRKPMCKIAIQPAIPGLCGMHAKALSRTAGKHTAGINLPQTILSVVKSYSQSPGL